MYFGRTSPKASSYHLHYFLIHTSIFIEEGTDYVIPMFYLYMQKDYRIRNRLHTF